VARTRNEESESDSPDVKLGELLKASRQGMGKTLPRYLVYWSLWGSQATEEDCKISLKLLEHDMSEKAEE